MNELRRSKRRRWCCWGDPWKIWKTDG